MPDGSGHVNSPNPLLPAGPVKECFDAQEVRLAALEMRCDAQEVRIAALQTRSDAQEVRLDEPDTRIDDLDHARVTARNGAITRSVLGFVVGIVVGVTAVSLALHLRPDSDTVGVAPADTASQSGTNTPSTNAPVLLATIAPTSKPATAATDAPTATPPVPTSSPTDSPTNAPSPVQFVADLITASRLADLIWDHTLDSSGGLTSLLSTALATTTLPFFTALDAADSLFVVTCDGPPGVVLNNRWSARDKALGFLCYTDDTAAGFCVGRYKGNYTKPIPAGLFHKPLSEIKIQQDTATFTVNGASAPYDVDVQPDDLHAAQSGIMDFAKTKAHEVKKPCLTRSFNPNWDFPREFSGIFRCPEGMVQVGVKVKHDEYNKGRYGPYTYQWMSFECRTLSCFG